MLKIAAVVCTYNRYDYLVKAIHSLLAQSLPQNNYEILIIDNTPDAKNAPGRQLSKEFSGLKNLKYIFEETPGLSNARNVAMVNTEAKYISYLDDDAIASGNWLEAIIEAFELTDEVGVVGGKILPIWESKRPLWLADSMLGHVSVVDWGGSLRVAEEDEWFAGANISFLRSLLLACDGFSTSLGRVGTGNCLMSNEETQILQYIKGQGHKAVYAPKALVDHMVEKKRITRDWYRRRIAWQAVSDFVMNAESLDLQMSKSLKNIKAYLASLPPLQRNVQGLYLATDDPGTFAWQLSALYEFTTLTLAGFEGLENV